LRSKIIAKLRTERRVRAPYLFMIQNRPEDDRASQRAPAFVTKPTRRCSEAAYVLGACGIAHPRNLSIDAGDVANQNYRER
jgi:hypothetical protein